MTTIFDQKMVISHRGLNTVAPENTLPAFELAAEAGVKWIETDVDILGDGTAVILHDTDMDRTTNRTGPLYKYTAADLPNIDAGSWFSADFHGCPMPTLSQLIDFCNDHEIDLNLEIKANLAGKDSALQLVRTVAEELERLSPDRQLIVSSFSHLQLMKFHEIAPQHTTATLYSRLNLSPAWKTTAELCGASYLNLEDVVVTREIVETISSAGYGVNVWTVNSADRANELFNWGCTGIFTDIADQIPTPTN